MFFRKLLVCASVCTFVAAGGTSVSAAQKQNIVLVHGAFVDGSGWAAVYKILKNDGYNVIVVQNPTISLTGDVAAAKRAIDSVNGDVLLVGHSYGGAVITEAGNDPKVTGLVYITAFAPDKGESVASLLGSPAAHGAPAPPILPPQDGFLMLDKAKFAEAFAADVNPDVANFMANSQVPWGLESLNTPITQPAWRTKKTWYLMVSGDHMIAPALQQYMAQRMHATVSQTPGNHAIYVSKPDLVAHLIEQAATAESAAAH
jgi:pimeloyl-ACP methyl ester carboxylesterase